MLQIQYYNKGLSKTQIEQIIKNYNLKYTTLTNEINLKLNSIIKTVLNDITPFLENIEYLSKQAKQIKEFEHTKNRIEMLENKLKEKTLIEKELQTNINNLKQEINELKEKGKEYEKNIKLKDELLLKAEGNKPKTQNTNNKTKKRKKTLELNKVKSVSSSSLDKLEIAKEDKISRNEEENKINTNYINTSFKKQKQKSILKWNKDNNKYMMNLKELTRNLTGYHEKVMSNKNNQNINKFISGSNKKEEKKEKKEIKNKKRIVHSSLTKELEINKKMRFSSDINKVSRFEINKDSESDKENNDFIKENKSYILLYTFSSFLLKKRTKKIKKMKHSNIFNKNILNKLYFSNFLITNLNLSKRDFSNSFFIIFIFYNKLSFMQKKRLN